MYRLLLALSICLLSTLAFAQEGAGNSKAPSTLNRVPLPGRVNDIVVGGAGRYLCLYFSDMGKIGIFDVEQAKIVGFVPAVDHSVMMAAGSESLVVLLGSKNKVLRYDLATRTQEFSGALDFADKVAAIVMGSASNGPLMVVPTVKSLVGDEPVAFFDIARMNVVKFPYERELERLEQAQFRASPEGLQFVVDAQEGKVGIRLLKNKSELFHGEELRSMIGTIDGERIGPPVYTKSVNEVPAKPLPLAAMIPATFGGLFLKIPAIEDGQTHVRGLPTLHFPRQAAPIATLADFDLQLTSNDLSAFGPYPVDKRVFLLPWVDLVVMLEPGNRGLRLERLNLNQALQKSKLNHLLVTSIPPVSVAPGKPLRHQLTIKSKEQGVVCELLEGPLGMTITESGLLTWSAPATPGHHHVSITLRNDSGKGAFYAFSLAVRSEKKATAETATIEKPVPPIAKFKIPEGFGQVPPITPAPLRRRSVRSPEPISFKAPAIPGKKLTYKLPDKVSDMAVGGGGRYWCYYFADRQAIAIFDVSQAKITGEIAAPGKHVLLAAGAEKLVVLNGYENKLVRWDLATRAKEAEAPVENAVQILQIAMGAGSHGPLGIARVIRNEAKFALFDLEKLALADYEMPFQNLIYYKRARLRSNYDGQLFVLSTSNDMMFRIVGQRVDAVRGDLQAAYYIPNDDYSLFYGRSAVPVPGAVKKAAPPPKADAPKKPEQNSPLPALRGPEFVVLTPPAQAEAENSSGSLHTVGKPAKMFRLPKLPVVPSPANLSDQARLLLEKQIYLIPEANLLGVLADTHDELELYRLDSLAPLDKVDYPVVVSPSPKTAKVRAQTDFPIQLASPLEGMKYAQGGGFSIPAPNTLRVFPEETSAPFYAASLYARDAEGREFVYTFGVEIQGTEGRAAALKSFAKDETVALRLPGKVEDVQPAGGGRWLILHLKSMGKLAVLDLSTAKIEKFLPADDLLHYTAGADKLVTLLSNGTLERWSLRTFEREQVARLDIAKLDTLTSFCMGSASMGPIFMGRTGEPPEWLNLATFTMMPFEWTAKEPLKTEDRVRPSADGRQFFVCGRDRGVRHVTFQGDGMKVAEIERYGNLYPSYDARHLLSELGVYSTDFSPVEPESKIWTTPIVALEGDFYLRIWLNDRRRGEPQAEANLFRFGDPNSLGTLDGLQTMLKTMLKAPPTSLPLQKRVFFSPAAGVLVLLPEGEDQVELRPFDPYELLKSSSSDYLLVSSRPPLAVAPGQALSYQLETASKFPLVESRLVSGPDGMAISPQGLLTWTVASKPGTELIVINLKSSSGKQTFHTFQLDIKLPPGAVAPAAAPPDKSEPTDVDPEKPIKPAPSVAKEPGVPQMRTWRDRNDEEFRAIFVAMEKGKIRLKKEDDTVVEYTPAELSPADVSYVIKLLRK